MTIVKVFSAIGLEIVVIVNLMGMCMATIRTNHLSPQDIVRDNMAAKMKSYMNISALPCDDFYQYACGNWDASHPLREDQDEINAFSKLASRETEVWRKLLQNSRNKNKLGDAYKKAKTFFESCVDMERIEQRGTTPLVEYLQSFAGWPAIDPNWNETGSDWLKLHAEMEIMGEQKIISAEVRTDIFNASSKSLYLLYPTMTLGYQRHYSNESKIFSGYKTLLRGSLKALNVPEDRIEAEFEDILNFELKMSKIVLDFDNYNDDIGAYKVTTLGDLEKNFTSIDWKKYLYLLSNTSYNSSDRVIIHGDYLKNLDTLLKTTSKRTLFNYMGWHISSELLLFLGARYVTLRHNMEAIMTGVEKQPPHLEYCIDETKKHFEAVLGSAYAQRMFNEKARKDAKNFFSRVKDSFRKFIADADWIDSKSKNNLNLKLEHLDIEVGYPDLILNSTKVNELYENFTMKKDDYFGNQLQLRTASFYLGWPVSFTIANAVYSDLKMYITALMFQPPFYHKDLPKFVNFAGIGSVTAHEMSHAFDTDAILYDHKGEANNWFSNSSMSSYKEKEKCFVEKYGNYTLNGVNLDGDQILGEVVADDVGIKAAFVAYKKWFEKANIAEKCNEQLSGFTESKEQMFFLSFAQSHCSHIRASAFQFKVQTDTHAVQKYRVNGVLSNLESFSDAFGCPVGSAMNPERKCIVW